MRVFALIRNRPTWVVGTPGGGWGGAEPEAPGATLLPFHFDIHDSGGGSCILAFYSADGSFAADTWHESLEDAFAVAEEEFGIRPSEWSRPNEPDLHGATSPPV